MKHKEYPKITDLKQLISYVKYRNDYCGKDENGDPIYEHIGEYPILKMHGTEKLHGTNAAIVKTNDGIYFQSRNNIITPQSDNAGFAGYMSTIDLSFLFEDIDFENEIIIYGEWCGGNIQQAKETGLHGLPKCFVIFEVIVDGVTIDRSYREDPELHIFDVSRFGDYYVEINVEDYAKEAEQIKEWVLAIHKESPAAKNLWAFFGNIPEDKKLIGEGIVFSCEVNGETYRFKARHDHYIDKPVRVASVGPNRTAEFKVYADSVCNEARLSQFIAKMRNEGKPVVMTAIRDYINEVKEDVFIECANEMKELNIDKKDIGQFIDMKAKIYYSKNKD